MVVEAPGCPGAEVSIECGKSGRDEGWLELVQKGKGRGGLHSVEGGQV